MWLLFFLLFFIIKRKGEGSEERSAEDHYQNHGFTDSRYFLCIQWQNHIGKKAFAKNRMSKALTVQKKIADGRTDRQTHRSFY